jgi:hypothetical protein
VARAPDQPLAMNARQPEPQAYLQAMYKEQCDQARQHEGMRQQSTTLILALSGALAAVAGTALSATAKILMDAGVPWVVATYALVGWIIVRLAHLGQWTLVVIDLQFANSTPSDR